MASNPLNNGSTNIGIWTNGASWQKSPYAMVAACSMIKEARLFGSGFNQRALELALLLGIDYNIEFEPIPHLELLKKMQQMHINLYVTFSECADTSFEIANKAKIASDERETIILEYIKYAKGYNQRARQSVINFIED